MAKNKKMVTAMAAQESDWQTDCDLRTLCEAEEIRKDPKRMAKATARAKEKMMEMASIATDGDSDD